MLPEADYTYDVFVSYTRDHPVGTWVKERFMRDFVGFLSDELGRRSLVFFDQDAISAGEIWEDRLRWGLKFSRVLLAVCSGRYFKDSQYCSMEWSSFGKVCLDESHPESTIYRPIVPLRYSDGNTFPPEAKALQAADFVNANSIIEAFYKNDVRAIAYEDNLRALSQAVARAIEAAPPFDPRFPVGKATPVMSVRIGQPRL
jgi:hypothetical protein